MLIRDARPEEYEEVGSLVADVYATIIPGLDDYAHDLRDVAGRIDAGVLVWVAEVEGAIAGTVSYVPGLGPYAEFEDPHGAGIRMLAVLPVFQGHGVGMALVQACLDRARVDQRSAVYLDTTRWMETAQRMYARMGFERTPELDWEPLPGMTLFKYIYRLAPDAAPS